MSKKNKKILSQKLTDLVGKYSGSNILYQLEKEYKILPNRLVNVDEIDDSVFLKRIKYNQKQLDVLINAYNNNSFIEPLIVRPKKDHYEVVVGRRRLHAVRASEKSQIHVIVGDFSDEETLLIMLTIARDEHNVNPIELALIFSYLTRDYNYTQQQLATLTRISRPQVTNICRMLTLPDSIVSDVIRGKLKFGHARSLITLPENHALELAEIAKKEALNVRSLELLAQSYKTNKKIEHHPLDIEKDGLKVSVTFKNKTEQDKFIKYIKSHYGS